MDTPTPQTSTQSPASGETPCPGFPDCECGRPHIRDSGETPEQTILDRWNYSGQPSVDSFNHAVDVANANYQRAQRLQSQLTLLTQTLDQDRQTIASLREEKSSFTALASAVHPSIPNGEDSGQLLRASAVDARDNGITRSAAYCVLNAAAKEVDELHAQVQQLTEERDRAIVQAEALVELEKGYR